jgi:hypothetical protein
MRFVAKNANSAAKYLLRHIERLKGTALDSWRQAHHRIFDIGVRAGGPGRAYEEVQLSAGTLKRIAAVRAQIKVTVYPAEAKSGPAARGRRQTASNPGTRGRTPRARAR